MTDIKLVIDALRKRGHTVGEVVHVSETAGDYQLIVDNNVIDLAEARALLEQDELK